MNGADTVLLLPVYEAGEGAIDGINSDALAEGLRSHGHRHVVSLAKMMICPMRWPKFCKPMMW